MPIAFPDDALQEFRLLTDELEASLRAAGTIADVQKRLGALDWGSLGQKAQQLLGFISKQKKVDITTIYRGLSVALAGAPEHFTRRLIRDAVSFYGKPTDAALHVVLQMTRTGGRRDSQQLRLPVREQ